MFGGFESPSKFPAGREENGFDATIEHMGQGRGGDVAPPDDDNPIDARDWNRQDNVSVLQAEKFARFQFEARARMG
jgi:hypothetical protein